MRGCARLVTKRITRGAVQCAFPLLPTHVGARAGSRTISSLGQHELLPLTTKARWQRRRQRRRQRARHRIRDLQGAGIIFKTWCYGRFA